jgi:hypothetical protein
MATAAMSSSTRSVPPQSTAKACGEKLNLKGRAGRSRTVCMVSRAFGLAAEASLCCSQLHTGKEAR